MRFRHNVSLYLCLLTLSSLSLVSAVSVGECALRAGGSFVARLDSHTHLNSFLEYDINAGVFPKSSAQPGIYNVGEVTDMLLLDSVDLFLAGNFQKGTVPGDCIARQNVTDFSFGDLREGVWNVNYQPGVDTNLDQPATEVFLASWQDSTLIAGNIIIESLNDGLEVNLAAFNRLTGAWSHMTSTGLCPLGHCQVQSLAAKGDDVYLATRYDGSEEIDLYVLTASTDVWVAVPPVEVVDGGDARRLQIAYDTLTVNDESLFALASYSDSTGIMDADSFYLVAWNRTTMEPSTFYFWTRSCSESTLATATFLLWGLPNDSNSTVLISYPSDACHAALHFKALTHTDSTIEETECLLPPLAELETAYMMAGEQGKTFLVTDGMNAFFYDGSLWRQAEFSTPGVFRAMIYHSDYDRVYVAISDGEGGQQMVVEYWSPSSNYGHTILVNGLQQSATVNAVSVMSDEHILIGGTFMFTDWLPGNVATVWDGSQWLRTTQSVSGFETLHTVAAAGLGSLTYGVLMDTSTSYTTNSLMPFLVWSKSGYWQNIPGRPSFQHDDRSQELIAEDIGCVFADTKNQVVYFAGTFSASVGSDTAKGVVSYDTKTGEWGTLPADLYGVTSMALVNNGMYLVIGGTFTVEIDGAIFTNLVAYDTLNHVWANRIVAPAVTHAVNSIYALPDSSKLVVGGVMSDSDPGCGVGVLDYGSLSWATDCGIEGPVTHIVADTKGQVFVASTNEAEPAIWYQTGLNAAWQPLLPSGDGVLWSGEIMTMVMDCPQAVIDPPSPPPLPIASSGEVGVDQQTYEWTTCVAEDNSTYQCIKTETEGFPGWELGLLILVVGFTVLFVAAVLLVVFFIKHSQKEEPDDMDFTF